MKTNPKAHFMLFILIGILSSFQALHAQDLTLSSLFSDHMVLQRNQPVPVWGKAAPMDNITIHFAGQSNSTTVDKDGNWQITLDPLVSSIVGRDMIISGNQDITLSDILVGEVWICSGQSNMQLPVSRIPEVNGLIPFIKNIRSFEVKRTVSLVEEGELSGAWSSSHPQSAVAFSFAYFLQNLSNVPIGIIHASWGSSSIEAWMPRDMTATVPHFKTIMEEFDEDIITQHKITDIVSQADGWSNREDIYLRRQPNILYNAMINPIAPYACKGLVWYQGERNTRYLSGMPEVTEKNWFHRVAGMKEYGSVLKEWVLRLRQEWGNESMNFMVVMLPGFGGGTVADKEIDPESPSAESWAWFRESQMQVLDLAYTSVVNTIDLGDVKNIHPLDKLPIGQRLALLAAKNAIGQDLIAEGPKMSKVEVLNDKIVLHFEGTAGLTTSDGKNPKAFWISDESGAWKQATALIDNDTVVLSVEGLTCPKYVRYAFSGKPLVNLVNEIGLPAYPFRTDSFKK